MSPYAWLCLACCHLATRHLLEPDGDLREGPYRCKDCSCTIRQDSPMSGMSRRQYEDWNGPKWEPDRVS